MDISIIVLFILFFKNIPSTNHFAIGISTSDSQDDVFLDDFFWTGSGDDPAPNLEMDNKNQKDIIIKTETILATVYIDDNNDIDIPICLSCITDVGKDLSLNLSKIDRRYWLLTILSGVYTSKDFLFLESKLASLYRLAFTREQSKHFGIFNNTSVLKSDIGIFDDHNDIHRFVKNNVSRNSDNYYSHRRRTDIDSIEFKNQITSDLQLRSLLNKDQVQVLIHNISVLSEIDLQSGYQTEILNKLKPHPWQNQTELIYSVFFGKNPVLASAAAADMTLLNDKEINSAFGVSVLLASEPYLKEPQATPLVPGTNEDRKPGIYASINRNIWSIITCSILIFLIIFLLITLIIMQRTTKEQQLTTKETISPDINLPPPLLNELTNTNSSEHARSDHPYIEFPQPSSLGGRRYSSTSSTNTSDSSLYCPLQAPSVDMHLNKKVPTLLDKQNITENNISEINSQPIYTSVKSYRHKGRKLRQKHKRGDNRVGSIQKAHPDIHKYPKDSKSPEIKTSNGLTACNYYNSNKLFNSTFLVEKTYDEIQDTSSTKIINKEIIRALQPDDKSSESESIGSFLSMNSVKNFPKGQLPQPLQRVLDPVSVTYYDQIRRPQSDNGIQKNYKTSKHKLYPDVCHHLPLGSYSDISDPGVINTIVCNDQHKLHFQKLAESQMICNPAESQKRFEGILEEAFQMYSGKTELKEVLRYTNFHESTRSNCKNPNRGKSASDLRLPKPYACTRPSTAHNTEKSTLKEQLTNQNAWGSSDNQLNAVRPLSAGPFHKPKPPNVDVSKIGYSQQSVKEELSAAPLIEAIQYELNKFKRENGQ